MNRLGTSLMILLWLTTTIMGVYLINQQKNVPVFDPDTSYKNVVPMITSEVNCEQNTITWYIRNQYDMQFKIQRLGRNNDTLSRPEVQISPNGVYEFNDVIPQSDGGVSLEVSGEYKFLAEPNYYYDIDVSIIGNADVSQCKEVM